MREKELNVQLGASVQTQEVRKGKKKNSAEAVNLGIQPIQIQIRFS